MDRTDRQRGATLSLFAFAASMALLAFGAMYLASSQHVYRMAVLRERRAQARAAAEAALAVAVARAGADGTSANGEEPLGAAVATWTSEPAEAGRRLVRAVGTVTAGRERLDVALRAEVERGPDGRARVVRLVRE